MLRRCEWRWLKSYRCDAAGSVLASHGPSLCSSTIVSVRWLRRRTNSATFMYKHKEKYQDKDSSIYKDCRKIVRSNGGKSLCPYQPKTK